MPRYLILIAAIGVSATSTNVLAQSASSSAYAVSANETATVGGIATANVNVSPVAPSSGSAPPSYNNSNSVASVSNSTVLTSGVAGVSQGLQTGLLTTNATGTSTGANATATINGLTFDLGTSQLLSSLLGLNATTIQSYSQATSAGGLSASGSTLIEGLTLSGSALGGLTIDGSLFSSPSPNTILLNVGGLKIVLNEQTSLGDGINSLGISTNAIDVSFNNFVTGTGLLNGNVIVGHTQALASLGQAGAVPEPSTWAMMLLGFGAIGLAARRRRSSRHAALATL